ncbi:MAG: FG-GAP-like repeat-containing protein, partial [Gammaproteobacteria bacterium]
GSSLVFDTIAEVRTVIDSTTVQVDSNVAYICEVTPYSVQRNPQDIVMYSPNAAILWPGALIQGVTHRDGLGSLLPLVINERAAINVSIPAIQTGTNFRRVDTVDQAHVASAIGSIVGNATASGLQTASSIFFYQETYNSQRQFGLAANISGRYLGFEGAAGGSINRNSSETTISAHFYQKMFTVVVSPPSTPGGWFSGAFTPAVLQQQVSLGRIGPGNLPVYVGEIVYGRMMMFSITSTASATELRTMINASYQNLTGQVSGGLSTRHQTILSESRISIASLGGNDSATIAMIRTGDWSAYFTASSPLSTAEPLSYAFYNIGDNSLASVTEATNYNVNACAATTGGQYDFLPAQSLTAPVPVPYETYLADVNADNLDDLIYAHASVASGNQVAVSLAVGDGTFGAPATYTNSQPAPPEAWANYQLAVGDVTGDSRADLVWNNRASANKTYVAVALAGGGFRFDPVQVHPTGAWVSLYTFQLGDVDADGDKDIVWNYTYNGGNRTYVGLASDTARFSFPAFDQHPTGGDWRGWTLHLGDLNQDGRADLIWTAVPGRASPNDTYTALSQGGGVFGAEKTHVYPVACCWTGYRPLIGDFNRDQVADIVWNGANTGNWVHKVLGNGSGGWIVPQSNPYHQDLTTETGTGPFTARVGDVDADGATDIIWSSTTATKLKVAVGRGTAPSGAIDAGVQPYQTHPVSTNWNGALPHLIGRVTTSGRADVVWVIPGMPTRVFVARSRPG